MRRETGIALVLCLCCVLAGCATGATDGGGGTGATSASTTPNAETAPADVGGGTDANASGPGAFEATLNATVVDVADGDTVDVRLANGTKETVRLVGVDTPEVWVENTPGEFRGVPNTSAGRDCLRGWGHNASAYTTSQLAGANVTLAFDPGTDRRGYYGRLLAYVYVNGTNHNRALVERGLARVYDSGFSREPAFRDAADAAYANRTGLWTCAVDGTGSGTAAGGGMTANSGTTSGSGTRGSGAASGDGGAGDESVSGTASGLTVAAVHADASGPDSENLNDEYVVLHNAGAAPVDLSGAHVTDAVDHSYSFPNGTTLAPDAFLTLHTGAGADGDGDYYWAAGSPIWNNGGDTVTVTASNGTRLAHRSYD